LGSLVDVNVARAEHSKLEMLESWEDSKLKELLGLN